jgi:hypothetical protein
MLIAQLRTNSHQLGYETTSVGKDQRKLGKKGCVCFAPPDKWKHKKHFILECEALKDNRDNYVSILTTSSWDNLLSEGTMEKLGKPIIKLNKKKAEMQNKCYRLVYHWWRLVYHWWLRLKFLNRISI